VLVDIEGWNRGCEALNRTGSFFRSDYLGHISGMHSRYFNRSIFGSVNCIELSYFIELLPM
jgi:hypothetical protein